MADAKRQIASMLMGEQPQQRWSLADLGRYYPVPEPTKAYTSWVLPLSRDAFGSVSFDSDAGLIGLGKRVAQGALSSAWSGVTAPGDAYAGRLPMMDGSGNTSLEAIGRGADLAGLITLGAGAIPAEAGGMALNAGLSGLRQKYAPYLREASGGKDPARIKLTPERVAAAKEAMRTASGMYPEGRPNPPVGSLPSPYRVTEQARLAADFAAQARQQLGDVRVKFPEGPKGSVYVRVGDNGTVRFADHLPPIENGQIVGGYSKDLGRRHQPATVDVSRGKYQENIDPAPAYNWLAKILAGDAI